MTQQDEGWPLGLQPLNARIELTRSGNNSGSVSFNTLVTTASPSSTDFSSSGFDTESTGSFFPDKSTTLGSLMGVSSIVELSRRSLRGSKTELFNIKKENKKFNFISRLFYLSSRSSSITHEAENHRNNAHVPSLAQYLAVERKTSNENRKIQDQKPFIYGPEHDLALAETNNIAETNSLFVNGNIAPPQIQTRSISNSRENNRFGSFAEIFSCICG